MSGENRTPTRWFSELGDPHNLGESASYGKDNLLSQLLDGRMTPSEIDGRLNAIVTPLSTHSELLIQSVRELNQRSSTRSTEWNLTSDRSRSSNQRSNS